MRTILKPRSAYAVISCLFLAAAIAPGCGTPADPVEPGVGGTQSVGGAAGTAGTTSAGGSAGTTSVGGSAGTTSVGGSAGTTSVGGSAGTTSVGGSAGAEVTGGNAGSAGTLAGAGGAAGAAGTAQSGSGGTAGDTSAGGSTSGGAGGTSGDTGSGGVPPTGGTAGDASGGTAGTGPVDLTEVAEPLNGLVILLPCQGGTGEVCQTNQAGQGCPSNADLFQDGVRTTNEEVTIGGDPGTNYEITLRFQGIVENRTYINGMDQSTMQSDGFYSGGAPQPGTGDYNIYALRAASPQKDYFLNAIGNTSFNRHQAFVVDYTATIVMTGGSSLTAIAQDTNCSAIRNCTDAPDNGQCSSTGVPNLDPAIASGIGGGNGSAYNGQFIGMVVVDVVVAQ
jgi:hypothetical protein